MASTKSVSEARVIAFSVGDFDFLTTNHVAAISTKDGVHEDFHPIMDFMKNSSIGYALSEATAINTKAVSQAWASAKVESNGDISCTVGEVQVIINTEVVRSALHLEESDVFNAPATDDKVKDMLKTLGYAGSVENLSKLVRKHLRKE